MKNKTIVLVLIFFVLNLIWEFSHSRLYIDLTGIPTALHLISASFVDVFLLLGIFFISSKISKSRTVFKQNYFIFVLISLAVAGIWEFVNLELGRWQYTISMPTIFGIGLSPLLQLAVTGILGLEIFKRVSH